MIFKPLELEGVFLITPQPHEDERGSFARMWCAETFAEQGIGMDIAQSSVSHSVARGTLRGLHFQWLPSIEAKLVRCERGKIYDVIVDLRPDSPTFTAHLALELDERSRSTLYVPAGFAHGFQTLEDNCHVLYMMSDVYQPALADGVRYNDPVFGINWPEPVTCIAQRDSAYPDFDRAAHTHRYINAE